MKMPKLPTQKISTVLTVIMILIFAAFVYFEAGWFTAISVAYTLAMVELLKTGYWDLIKKMLKDAETSSLINSRTYRLNNEWEVMKKKFKRSKEELNTLSIMIRRRQEAIQENINEFREDIELMKTSKAKNEKDIDMLQTVSDIQAASLQAVSELLEEMTGVVRELQYARND